MANVNGISSNDAQTEDGNKTCITTEVDDVPPWNITLTSALQLVMSNISAIVSSAFVVYSGICPGDNKVLFAELISIAIFMSGLSTLIQVAVGVRLPIVQASSSAVFPVIGAMMNTPRWQCPYGNSSGHYNISQDGVEPWVPRVLELSGSLAGASCIQVFLGCSGVIGYLTNYIGPITLITVLSLVGLTLSGLGIPGARCQWGIAAMTAGLVVLFSLVIDHVHLPLPAYNKTKGWHMVRYPVFRLFPNLFALVLTWLLCYILTITDVFPNDPSELQYKARTDVKMDAIYQSKWFFVPYPGRWGVPTFGAGTFVGMIAAIMASVLESLGDYHAMAKVCDVPPPPKHAINRGIAAEGLGSIMSGLMGACHATTSYSNTPVIIQITGVKSRVVMYVFGIAMVMFGMCGKIGAALSIVPEPILSGMLTVSLGMVAAIGLTLIKNIPVTSRNMMVLGLSLILGMMLPQATRQDTKMIHTGNVEVDNVLSVMLSNGLFVGGVVSLLLDNLIPGTKEERGITRDLTDADQSHPHKLDSRSFTTVYDIPFITKYLKGIRFCARVPFLPTYREARTSPGGRSVATVDDIEMISDATIYNTSDVVTTTM